MHIACIKGYDIAHRNVSIGIYMATVNTLSSQKPLKKNNILKLNSN